MGGNQDDDSAENSGAVYVFHRADGSWRQEVYLKASNTGAGDFFGSVVAFSGDLLAVGASQEDSPARGVGGEQGDEFVTRETGAVYVFRRTGTTWQQDVFLKTPNAGVSDQFGASVALSGDTSRPARSTRTARRRA